MGCSSLRRARARRLEPSSARCGWVAGHDSGRAFREHRGGNRARANLNNEALLRECCRYDLDYDRVLQSYSGSAPGDRSDPSDRRSWWDYAIVAAAVGFFVYLGINARVPSLGMDFTWLSVLVVVLVASALLSGWGLWKATRFS